MMTSQIKEPSISTIMSIPDGKILDFLTKRFVNDTPEEYVRQNIEKALVRQYKYPIDSCKPEVSIKVGSSNKRVDVVIFEENKPHMQENAYILIETKKAKTNPHGKKDGIEQLKTYMAACLNAKFGLWTNGDERYCIAKREKDGGFLYDEIPEIPSFGQTEAEIYRPERKNLQIATADNLLFAFRRCHNYIAGNAGMHKDDAFWELLKVIFSKIEDERSGTINFYVTPSELKDKENTSLCKGWNVQFKNVFSRKRIDAAFYDWTTFDAVKKLREAGGYQLSTVAKIHKPGGRNKTNYVEKEYGLPILSGRQLLQNQTVGLKYLPKSSAEKYSSFSLKKGWIAYPADGRVEGRLGTPVLITDSRDGWFASGHVGRIEAHADIHPGYLYLAFSHPIVQAQLSAVACGSVVDAVYPEDVEKFIVPPHVEFNYDRVTTAWAMIDKADSLRNEACKILLQEMNA